MKESHHKTLGIQALKSLYKALGGKIKTCIERERCYFSSRLDANGILEYEKSKERIFLQIRYFHNLGVIKFINLDERIQDDVFDIINNNVLEKRNYQPLNNYRRNGNNHEFVDLLPSQLLHKIDDYQYIK